MLGGLAEKVTTIPEDERKTVCHIDEPGITAANTGRRICTRIKTVGAGNAMPESDLNADVSIEHVLGWDTDVVVVGDSGDVNGIYAEGLRAKDMP